MNRRPQRESYKYAPSRLMLMLFKLLINGLMQRYFIIVTIKKNIKNHRRLWHFLDSTPLTRPLCLGICAFLIQDERCQKEIASEKIAGV